MLRSVVAVEEWVVRITRIGAVLAALVAGVMTAQAVLQSAADQREQRQEVTARLTKDAPPAPPASVDGYGGHEVWTSVRWTATNGSTQKAKAPVQPGLKAGEWTVVWLDERGDVAIAPPDQLEGRMNAVWLGVPAMAIAAGTVLLGGRLVRQELLRRRLAEWGQEWEEVGPEWSRKLY